MLRPLLRSDKVGQTYCNGLATGLISGTYGQIHGEIFVTSDSLPSPFAQLHNWLLGQKIWSTDIVDRGLQGTATTLWLDSLHRLAPGTRCLLRDSLYARNISLIPDALEFPWNALDWAEWGQTLVLSKNGSSQLKLLNYRSSLDLDHHSSSGRPYLDLQYNSILRYRRSLLSCTTAVPLSRLPC